MTSICVLYESASNHEERNLHKPYLGTCWYIINKQTTFYARSAFLNNFKRFAQRRFKRSSKKYDRKIVLYIIFEMRCPRRRWWRDYPLLRWRARQMKFFRNVVNGYTPYINPFNVGRLLSHIQILCYERYIVEFGR